MPKENPYRIPYVVLPSQNTHEYYLDSLKRELSEIKSSIIELGTCMDKVQEIITDIDKRISDLERKDCDEVFR